MKQLSTKVTSNAHGQDSSYFLGWEEYEKNPYDEIKNPNGIIQMGLAENQVTIQLPVFNQSSNLYSYFLVLN